MNLMTDNKSQKLVGENEKIHICRVPLSSPNIRVNKWAEIIRDIEGCQLTGLIDIYRRVFHLLGPSLNICEIIQVIKRMFSDHITIILESYLDNSQIFVNQIIHFLIFHELKEKPKGKIKIILN